MKKTIVIIVVSLIFLPVNLLSEDGSNDLNFQKGPIKSKMKDIAEIDVPKDYVFCDDENTKVLMKKMGNQITEREVGYIGPKDFSWFIVFEFDEIGYVPDDDKDELDPDEILNNLREGNKEGNKWRKENGIPEMELIGWYKAPRYDDKTNNLEWGSLFKSNGKKLINYNIRILGRKGVMEAIVVGDNDKFDQILPQAKKLLTGYKYSSGNKYSEFAEGDKIAKYGLAALITGGGAAALAKSGLLKKFWKLIVAAIAAVGAFFKKLFGRKGKNSGTIQSETFQDDSKDAE